MRKRVKYCNWLKGWVKNESSSWLSNTEGSALKSYTQAIKLDSIGFMYFKYIFTYV